MKDEGAVDWKERFPNFHWTRKTNSKRGLRCVLRKERSILCFGGKEKEENESVKKILIFMCGKKKFMKKMCANKSMEGSYV
jgi:hypothetical protein